MRRPQGLRGSTPLPSAMPKILDLRKRAIKTSQAPQTRQNFTKQNLSEQKQKEEIKIEWSAPSFYYNPQKRHLSVLTAALLAGAVALLIFKYSALTSIFLILSSLVLLLYGNRKPTISKITVNQSGILVDDIMYY